MIILKSPREIAMMREAGRIAAHVHEELAKAIRPGVTTRELDALAEELITKAGAKPTFKGYHGYRASICTSINHEVVHGIPSDRQLRDGDIIAIDLGVTYRGYIGDSAYTWPVGQVSPEAKRLLEVTQQGLERAIEQCCAGKYLGDLGHAVQTHVESNGFSIVREYVGHGIGANLHEDPQVPNFGQPGTGVQLRAGMVLAIEPMVNTGSHQVKVLADQWTVVTADASYSAHFEHTVAITADGPQILTVP